MLVDLTEEEVEKCIAGLKIMDVEGLVGIDRRCNSYKIWRSVMDKLQSALKGD